MIIYSYSPYGGIQTHTVHKDSSGWCYFQDSNCTISFGDLDAYLSTDPWWARTRKEAVEKYIAKQERIIAAEQKGLTLAKEALKEGNYAAAAHRANQAKKTNGKTNS